MEATAAKKLEIQQRNEQPNMGGECSERRPDQELVSSNSSIPTSKFPSVDEPLSISHQAVSTKNSNANVSGSQYSLSNDIWKEILCRLPVKSLLRFRCVSKSWKSMIANPDFIRSHLGCFKYNCHQAHLLCLQWILRDYFEVVEECVVRCSDTSKITDCLDWYRTTNNRPFSTFGSTSNSYNWVPLSTIDGLVVLSRAIYVLGKSPRREYLLWNPSIQKIRSLIIPSMLEMEHEIIKDLGLGFDPLIKDYKFCRLVYHSDEAPLYIQVYTIGAGLWKTIQIEGRACSAQHVIHDAYQAICIASSIYILEKGNKELVSFNMSSEKFAFIQIPEHTNDDDSPTVVHEKLLRAEGGCSFLRISGVSVCRGYIWVLGTSGDHSESLCWSKHYSFTIIGDPFTPLRFIYLKENGDVLAEDGENIITVLNMENQEKLQLNGTLRKRTVNVLEYKESLLWIE